MARETMKAVVMHQTGDPDVLQYTEIPVPRPRPDQVLVEVKAIGVNFTDISSRRTGRHGPDAFPWVPGKEVAGIVTEVGGDVEGVTVGDRVMALMLETGWGYAQYCAVHHTLVHPIPDEMDFVQAAAIPLQGLTAFHALTTSGLLKAGERVLIHAAAGGVGSFAIQLAKNAFAAGQVLAGASTQEKLDLALSLGADVGVNYSSADWPQQVLDLTGGEGVDVILEAIGGDFRLRNFTCLADFGRLVIYGQASRQPALMETQQVTPKCHSLTGFFLYRVTERPEMYHSSLQRVLDTVAEGKVKPLIGGQFPLMEAAEVHRRMEERLTTGKLILLP